MKALVVGASGLIGSHVARALQSIASVECTGLTRVSNSARTLDIRDREATARCVSSIEPDVIVCAAAQPFVERCEREPSATAAINVNGTGNLVRAAEASGALFVFFSSDYVFDGQRAPYSEDDAVAPLNEYGRQKVAAEGLIREVPAHLICRVSGVFGVDGRRANFVYQVVDRISRSEVVHAAMDQTLCPTPALALAEAVRDLIVSGARGIVHVAGPEALTRADFARCIARAFGLPELVEGVPSSTLGLLASRPINSALRTDRLVSLLGHALPPPDQALAALRHSGL